MGTVTDRRWSNRVVCAGVAVTALGAAHLIEDFLYAVPADFGLTDPAAQVLAVIFFALLAGLLALSARGRPTGYLGLLGLGAFLTAADTAKHIDEILYDTPYRAGLFSKGLEVALILSSLTLAVISYLAWRSTRHAR
jgi:hypothetical protein